MRTAATRTIVGVVPATGVAAGAGWSAVKTATGGYTVTLAPGLRLLGVVASPTANASSKFAGVGTITDRSFGVTVVNTTPAFADGEFSFTATVAA